ncbi:cation channel family transporter (macronuclear) [Tetrahymena thermophila SB210]|uniref:Cation channel family transporter n=1 Tax=Tetrahymena thermophila (strain SB210) TaxID=312017 RepID=W7XFI6_TETTS|nr:cation channel family transporter [Tetrahymena thermophila SB210]EWS72781.1 cation channel family transporter [Tetrahymena thermophila SB210]|eukprot:XP_012654668.1 cation channel family transporter [Tetrahymena thermophila SB210]
MRPSVLEANWIRKLKKILKTEIKEEAIEEDQLSRYSKFQQNEELKRQRSESYQDYTSQDMNESSSFDLKNLQEEAEEHRNAYIKVANAFVEQNSDDSDNDIARANETDQQRIQRKVIKNHEREFEEDFQLNKLNEDTYPILDVVEMNVFDRIAIFQDNTIFEKIYKRVWLTKELISYSCFVIVNHPIFTIISLAVIIFNSIMLAKDDPTTNSDNNPEIDLALLIIYTVEMGLKIVAYGFIFSKNAYIKEGWNVIDLVIIVTGWLPYVVSQNAFNLSALRSLRVLRPLRSISKVKVLNQLVTALFSSIPLLKDAFIILLFFFTVFAIAGLQLFTGQLKTRCIDIYTGIKYGDENNNLFVCAVDSDCPPLKGASFICAKGMVSPNSDFYNFDTFGWSLLNVYVVVSNEGWSTIMYYVMVGFNFFAFIYFFLIVYLGTWLLVNLCMGIIAVKYTESIANQNTMVAIKKDGEEGYNMQNLIRWGIYKSNKVLYKELEEQKKKNRRLFQLSFQVSSLLASYRRSEKKNPTKLNQPKAIEQKQLNKVVPLALNQQSQDLFINSENNEDSKNPIIKQQQMDRINSADNNGKNGSSQSKNQGNSEDQNLQQDKNENMRQLTNLVIENGDQQQIHKNYKNLHENNNKNHHNTKILKEAAPLESKKHLTRNFRNEKKGTQLIDPSVLASDLEMINQENNIGKKRTKKTGTYVRGLRNGTHQNQTNMNPQQKIKKINFAPISKQKPKYKEEKINDDPTPREDQNYLAVEQDNDEENRRKSRNVPSQIVDIRRQSKKIKHLFKQKDEVSEDQLKLDDDIFLLQLEQKEKFTKNDLIGIEDEEIENIHFKKLQNDFKSLRQNKQIEQRSASSKKNSHQTNFQNHSEEPKQVHQKSKRNTSVSLQKKRENMLNGERKKDKSKSSRNQLQETESSADSLSDVSKMSFLEMDDTLIDKTPRNKTTVINNLYQEFDIKIGKTSKKLQEKKATKLLTQKQITPSIKHLKTYNTQEQENFEAPKIEEQILKKINKQIDLKAEDFKLMLDSKYLKPRVVYRQTNEYEGDVQPTKLNKQIQKLKNQQEEKIKRLKFRVKQQSSMIVQKDKKKKLQVQYKMPIQRSKRIDTMYAEKMFRDILEGKITTENHSIKQSKVADPKNDGISFETNPFKIAKNIAQRSQKGGTSVKNDDEKNDMNFLTQQRQFSTNQNNLFLKQITNKQRVNDVNSQVNNEDSSRQQDANSYVNGEHAENNLNGQQENSRLNNDSAAAQSNQAKSVNGEYEQKGLVLKRTFKDEVDQMDNKSQKNSLNGSIAQGSVDERQNPNNKSLNQANTSFRSKLTNKQTERKINVSGNIQVSKKGKNQKGDEIENDWNLEKAIQKIFMEEQVLEKDPLLDEKPNGDQKLQKIVNIQTAQVDVPAKNIQQKSQHDIFMYQLEQKFIKKAERQLDILNNHEPSQSQTDIKSVKSADTGIHSFSQGAQSELNNSSSSSQLSSSTRNVLVKKTVEVFDMVAFQNEPVDLQFLQQRKKEIYNLEKKGINQIKVQTSADDILWISLRNKNQKALNQVIDSLNYSSRIIEQNEGGFVGLVQAFRRRIRKLVTHQQFENLVMLFVLSNTIILCLDGIVPSSSSATLTQLNYIFTIIFAVDMGLKLIGLGFTEYVSDKMNIFDAIIVILSILELAVLSGSSSVSAFRSLRILRVFRVLRVTRLLRSLQFMKVLIAAISSTLEQFIYILLLLFLIMFIYALLGMNIFGGNWPTFNSNIPSRFNYDQFLNAYMAVLDLVTLENWNDQLTTCLLSNVSNYVCSAYLVSMIFIGNYILIDLVLAIMLDSFESDEVQKDRQEIENRFEIVQDITFGHTSMGSTFMNNLSQSNYASSNNMNRISTGLQNSSLHNSGGIQRSATLSKQAILKTSSQNDSGQFEKQKSVNGDDDSVSEKGGIASEQNLQDTGPKKKNQFQYYEGVECEQSLYIFSKDNIIRKTLYYVYKNPLFDKVVLLVIILTSFKLTFDTYIGSADVGATKFSNNADLFFTIFFICECVVKVVSLGFFLDEGSYLRDSWSQLDFFIVISSIIDLSLSQIDLGAIKILRLLRTLRPLRLLSQNKSMKLIVTALLQSMEGIANMIFVVLLIWLMFAILAMNLMGGKLFYCNTTGAVLQSSYNVYQYPYEKCMKLPGAFWDRYPNNNDNIGFSMVMLFELSTFEGWPNYFWYYMDGSDTGPVWNNSKYFSLFFAAFIFVGSFFSINLFTAIISFNFDIASKKAKNAYLTDEQSQWIELQRLIVRSTPDFTSMKPPSNFFRKFLWRIVESQKLEIFIISCIIGNVIVMAMTYDTSPQSFDQILSNINLAFTSVFIAESICKIIAYGPQGYFYKGWNQFDFFVVCASIVDIVMTFLGKSVIGFLRAGPQIIRILRVLRVSRLFKLMKSFQGLMKLIQTTIFAFPKFLNATLLFVLFYFIFSILAWYLFSDLRSGWRINTFWNFSNFHRAFILLFRMSTGEDWYLVMYDTFNAKGVYGILFFVTFYTVQSYILMNLFVLIIMNEFEENYINPDNPLNNFNEQEDDFKKRWVIMTIKDSGIKIHEKNIPDFYFELQEPLGFDYKRKSNEFVEKLKMHDTEITQDEINLKLDKYKIRQKQEADKNVMRMNIFCDYEGYVYYNELLYQFMKFSLYEQVYELSIEDQNDPKLVKKHNTALDIMRKEEKVSMKKIQIIKKKQSSLLKSKIVHQRQQGVNPMVRRLFVGMAFKSWLQYSIKMQDNMNQINFNREDISSQTDTDNSQDEDLENEEEENLFLNQSFEDGIQFKKQKPKIIKREHTVALRIDGLRKYREEQNTGKQIYQGKKYFYIPDTNIYQIDNYDEYNNQDYNSHTFQVEQKQDLQVENNQLYRKSIFDRPSLRMANPLQFRQSIASLQQDDSNEKNGSQQNLTPGYHSKEKQK